MAEHPPQLAQVLRVCRRRARALWHFVAQSFVARCRARRDAEDGRLRLDEPRRRRRLLPRPNRPLRQYVNLDHVADLRPVLRVDAEGTGLEGGLAETWDVSDDNLTYTFHLRETNFHDGTPCTSEDVAFCLDRTVKGEESGWAFLFSAVDKIEATDPQTVVITLTTPWAPFEADLALYGASIFPKAA